MAFAQKAVAIVFFGAVAEGFRVKPKKKQDKQVTNENPSVDQQTMLSVNTQAALEMGRSLPKNEFAVSNNAECRLSQSDCNIGDMSGPTVVYTDDANSRCLNGDGFAFLVKPGLTDKLLFYFPGGGACWKGSSSNAELCLQSLSEGLGAAGLGSGVTEDRANNGFADWTFVAPAYCDGGAFVSNSTLSGKRQDGYVNTNYAVQWAKRNLDQNLANFAIAGSSAGALGTMAWSNSLLSTFQYNKAAVIVDSYMGVFPPGTQGPTIRNFGACNLPVFANFRAVCEAGNSNIQDVFDYAIEKYPNVAFSMIQSKGDLVQIGFYAAIASSFGKFDIILAPGMYERTNTIMERFGRHDNFVHFHIDGSGHTFLQTDNYYSQTTGGSGSPTLVGWTGEVVEHQPVSSACNGPLQKNGGNSFIFKNTKYCYKELYPEALKVR